jgi:hypothetical protein
MEYSTYKRLNKNEIESFLDKDDNILFLGPGDKVGLNVLLSVSHEVLNIDVCDKPVSSDLNWLKADVWGLDFDDYKNDYDAVILQRLCSKEYQGLTPLILLPKLVGFSKIVIEFCDNTDHYVDGKMGIESTALKCDSLLKDEGYFNRLILNNHDLYRVRLFASKDDLPVIQKPEIATGMPQGYMWGPWDGNYYD